MESEEPEAEAAPPRPIIRAEELQPSTEPMSEPGTSAAVQQQQATADPELVTVADINDGCRKKKKKKRASNNARYKDKDPLAVNFSKPCNHKPGSKFKCSKFRIALVILNRKLMHKQQRKVDQDTYLTRLIAPYAPARRKNLPTAPGGRRKSRTLSIAFFLVDRKRKYRAVCKRMFMAVLNITAARIKTIANTVSSGNIPTERRGGDRKSQKSASKRQKVCDFLKKFPASESHYNRNKSRRIYLSSDLSIAKLQRMYNASAEPQDKISKTMFREIFTTQFNIGFSSPASDACTQCILLKNQVKAEQDPFKKSQLMIEKRIHKLRANTFYDLAKSTPPKSISFCFDLQQVQPLPRTPVQEAFYARQVSLYNLCFVGMQSVNPHFYCWTEWQSGRGSEEVGSALIYHLCSLDYTDVEEVRLFCDGCGGQNKNSHIIHALLYWLNNKAPPGIKEVQITFPVRGHSFLPADRVFGRLEKHIRKIPVITTKEEYYQIFAKHGKVHILGTDWKLFKIKDLQNDFKKVQGIRELKRIHIKKKEGMRFNQNCEVHLHKHYKSDFFDEPPKKLLKPNKRYIMMLKEKPLRNKLPKEAKKRDVRQLLIKQFGENWADDEQLKWYTDILDGNQNEVDSDGEENGDVDDEEQCECLEHEMNIVTI